MPTSFFAQLQHDHALSDPMLRVLRDILACDARGHTYWTGRHGTTVRALGRRDLVTVERRVTPAQRRGQYLVHFGARPTATLAARAAD